MDFLATLNTVCRSFDEQGIRYALIGGFALAMRGVQRATVDLDLIVAAADRGDNLDWALIDDYLAIFEQPDRIDKIRSWYGPTD